ncbi:MAG: Crp/Fnr family transcriptional regulator [Clostridia bacterium]|nr:Crp/Fnr family transcriptional regulator [Oscillospiraceae bacterium]MBR2411557.1 Crp/Fnr family transcriptional regulator [Clostridia bacterium]
MKQTDISALRKCRLFTNCSDEAVNELLGSKKYEIRSYLKGEKVFSPDYFEKSIAVILKGSADVLKHTEKGALYMNTLCAGNIFGMSGIFYEGDSFPTTVTAKENSRILLITKEQLTQLFMTYPLMLTNYLEILSSKIHFLNKKIERLNSSDAKTALKNYLTELSDKNNSSEFILPVSYQKLSSMLSIGRTSVYRAFEELIKEGFIEKNGKVIIITERKENQ